MKNKKREKDNFEDTFIVIKGWMVSVIGLSGNNLNLFALIYGFSQDGTSEFTGSIEYIRKWLGCSKPTAINTLSFLVKNNLITKREVSKQKNAYRANIQFLIDVRNNFNGESIDLNSKLKYKPKPPKNKVGKDSLPVKNLSKTGKESLQKPVKNLSKTGKESLHNNIVKENSNKIGDKIEVKIPKNSPPPLSIIENLEIEKPTTIVAVSEKEKSCAKKEKQDLALDAIECIRHLNAQSGFTYSYSLEASPAAKSYVSHAFGLLLEGYTLEQIKLMIDFKCFQWNGTKLATNLNPGTLFKNHGVRYIEEAEQAQNNPAFKKAVQMAKGDQAPQIEDGYARSTEGIIIVKEGQAAPKKGIYFTE